MSKTLAAPGERLRAWWNRLSNLPGGRRMFTLMVGFAAPYSGSVRATVTDLAPGRARVVMRDRRAVRNHLDSVHAMALANLAELASGLAVLVSLPPGVRGILTGFDVAFLKKARGTLAAECQCAVPELAGSETVDHEVRTAITDAAGDVVAMASARWRLGPVR